MKRRTLLMMILILVLSLGVVCAWAVRLAIPRQPDTLQTQPTQIEEPDIPSVTSEPTAAPSTAATEPPLDVDTLIGSMAELTQDADVAFLGWVLDYFGEDVLLQLNAAFSGGYDREDWYRVTGNTWQVLSDLYTGAVDTEDNIHLLSLGTPGQENETTTLVFGGDICFADNYLTMEYMASTGSSLSECIDPALIDQMQLADITFMNNEFTISDRGTPMAGKKYTFRAKTENTALYQQLGVNIVSLANNHAFDYGEEAFLDTLDTLKAYGVAYFGGGRDLDEAMKPQYYIVNGRKIAFVAATRAEKNIMTPAAGEDSPGVLRCYDTSLVVQVIEQASAESDFVVACIHWGTEYSYKLEKAQTESAREYIDAGADLIIGAHAHQLQGIEFYNGKAIFYNLGNFWFNAYEIDTGLVKAELSDSGLISYTFLPALQKDCVTTAQIGTERGQQILETLRGYSINTIIDESGAVMQAGE